MRFFDRQQRKHFVLKRRHILINLLLLGCAGFLAYELASQWNEYRLTHNVTLLKAVSGTSDLTPQPGAAPVVVPNYSAIVDNDLFSADRTSVVPPEAPAETAKAPPPKPILVGTMQLDDDQFALMISDSQKENANYKQLKVGDVLDGYTLVSILDQKVMMKADGRDVEVRLSVNEPSKLVARESQPPGPPAKAGSVGQVMSIGSATAVAPGATAGGGTVTNRPLPKGYIPEGTIVNGRRKKLVPSPFGMMETWEEIK
jgi:hypothetical protein